MSALNELVVATCVDELQNDDYGDFAVRLTTTSFQTTNCFFLVHEDSESHSKILDYSEQVIPSYSLSDFRLHFRLTKEAFATLLDELGRYITVPIQRGGTPQIAAEKQLLITLWILSNQECFRSVADRFGIGRGTAHHVLMRVCKAINEHLFPKYVSWPDEEGIRENCIEFEKKYGIPGMVGAIDGCHISIQTPTKDAECYFNRKKFSSLVLQAVCNSKLLFIDIFFGYPGSVHDARVLRNSDFFRAAESGNLFPDGTFVLGDSAYPIKPWLMCPFRDNGYLIAKQKLFNTKLAAARSVIERAFGLLKGRFRRLRHVDMFRTDLISVVGVSCFTLHNFCLVHNNCDEIEEFLTDITNDPHTDTGHSAFVHRSTSSEGEERRVELMNYLIQL